MDTYARQFGFSRTGLAARFAAALLFTTATAVCARIAFHLWYTPVPITLQVLGVILSGLVLGSRWGAISQIQYLMLGAMGVPVFAGGIGGPAAFVGPTGGYLLGFVAGAYLAGLVFEKLRNRTTAAAFIAGAAGIFGVYLLGASWLGAWLGCFAGKGLGGGVSGAWFGGVVPFIGIDLLKAAAASGLAVGGRSGRELIETMRSL
jgi:biotin transport system substrate-specific component